MPTKIEWCEESWNPITGCSPVSEGCEHCYAQRMSQRLKGRYGYPEDNPFKVTFHPDRLEQPFKWKKPRHIFVCSMGDLFHPECFQDFVINDVYLTMAKATQHTFMVLTKRPDNMLEWYEKYMRKVDPPIPNIWLGVTAENQQRADERIPILLQIPAAKRFVSIEPMLGAVSLRHPAARGRSFRDWDWINKLDWVIAGGESGPGARPMHPDWPRSVRDQCQEAGVPFFFKQWGEWIPHLKRFGGGIFIKPDSTFTCQGDYWDGSAAAMNRVGKKAAGRLLDGREWNEVPQLGAPGEEKADG